MINIHKRNQVEFESEKVNITSQRRQVSKNLTYLLWKRQGTWHPQVNVPLNLMQLGRSGGKGFYWKAILRGVCLEILSHHSLLSSLLEFSHFKLNKQLVISSVFMTILIVHTHKDNKVKTFGKIHFSICILITNNCNNQSF